MLDYLRIALYVVLLAIGLMLYQAWEAEHPATTSSSTATSHPEQSTLTLPTNNGRYIPQNEMPNATTGSVSNAAPTEVVANPSAPKSPSTTIAPAGKFITVATDQFVAKIDPVGGDLVETKLLNYKQSLHSDAPIVLLNDQPDTRYLAESGLLSSFGPDTAQGQGVYTSKLDQYQLAPGEKEISVPLTWQKDGVRVTKIYTFKRDSYEITVTYLIDNQSNQPWQGNLYAQLARTDTPPPNGGGLVSLTTYFGGAVSTPDKRFNKISFKDMREHNLNQQIQNGWAAMIQHYFISAWIPDPKVIARYYTRPTPNDLYTIGFFGPDITVAPHTQFQTAAKLYSGPAIPDKMEQAAPGLNLTIDYGIFWFISSIIFWMMKKIYDVVGNWGWSIVIVTIIIKLMFYHLSAKSYRSMSNLKKLQPRIEMLKERYGDDKQQLTKATLELYKQEKVNPMSGCLPILIQIPVFIALYWVLVESVELRQAPFILWIKDLSQHDPYYVLPVLMGLSMFFQQRLSPPPPDPTQAKVMMLMPVIFTVLFANFPAGLMLYWFVNTSLSFLQQWYIMHKLDSEANKNSKSA